MELAAVAASCTGSTAPVVRLASQLRIAAAGLRPERAPTTRKYPAKVVTLDIGIQGVDRLCVSQGARLAPYMIIPPLSGAPHSGLISLLLDDIQHRIGDGQHVQGIEDPLLHQRRGTFPDYPLCKSAHLDLA